MLISVGVYGTGMHVYVRKDGELLAIEMNSADTANDLYRKYRAAAALIGHVKLSSADGTEIDESYKPLSDLGIGPETQIDASWKEIPVDEMNEEECRRFRYFWMREWDREDQGWSECFCREVAPDTESWEFLRFGEQCC